MSFSEELRSLLELEETRTVCDAFGGTKSSGATPSYSVSKIRDWIIERLPITDDVPSASELNRLYELTSPKLRKVIIGCCIRFSFLIELTNLSLGSTKMKTRWMSGHILMPQEGSYEPVQGLFEPGNDPRAASYDNCLAIFKRSLQLTCDSIQANGGVIDAITTLDKYNSVPYEFPIDYLDTSPNPVHREENIHWILNDDLLWLLKARGILNGHINKQEMNKIQTKTYKTDRSLRGKDKTNRARRWEVLSGDFQHASLTECWSVERKILEGLVCFLSFPENLKQAFIDQGLILANAPVTKCPITLLPLDYQHLTNAATHGISEYHIGHLYPLKRGGKHNGDNIAWQSSDGNRIQGNMTLEETRQLLKDIANRMAQAN